MTFVKLRGAYARNRSDFAGDVPASDLRVNPANVVSIGFGDVVIAVAVAGVVDVSLYCAMTKAEVVAAFAAAGVDL